MNKRNIITAFIFTMFMFCLVKVDAKAANVIEWKTERSNTGYDDYDITWTMYDDGTLEINGTGYLYLPGYSKYSSKAMSLTLADFRK